MSQFFEVYYILILTKKNSLYTSSDIRYINETAKPPATVSFLRKYNPAAQSSESRNNDRATFSRANVLDKNAISLATGAVFPQRSTATDGDLRRRARLARKNFHLRGNYAASFTGGHRPVVCSRSNSSAISRRGFIAGTLRSLP